MKMHFNFYIQRLLLAGAIFFFLGIHNLIASPVQIFENHKKNILSKNYIIYNDYIFVVGKIQSDHKKIQIGTNKATLEALSNIAYYYADTVKFPKQFNDLKLDIIREYLKTLKLEFSINRQNIVYQNIDNGKFTIVIAIHKNKVFFNEKNLSFEQIQKTLLSPKIYKSGKIKLTVCLEICENTISNDLLQTFADKMEVEYGKNIKQLILNKNAFTFQEIDSNNLQNLSEANLFNLLNKAPYDSEICFIIGKKLQQKGYKKTAQIFWSRGTAAPNYKPNFAKKCLKNLEKNYKCKQFISIPALLRNANYGTSNFVGELKFLNNYAGILPIGVNLKPQDKNFIAGEKAFKNNLLQEAYDNYVKSATTQLTFEACNMAGNAGRRIGNEHEAIALLLQATIADPTIVYPWVHLAWTYRKLNLKEQEQFCIQKIKNYKLDDWSSKQLKLLEK